MPDVVIQRDAVPLGYRVEATWGTDPLANNLPVLGLVKRCKVVFQQNREARRGVGQSVDPLLFVWKERNVTVELEYEVQDEREIDAGAGRPEGNSWLALALGDGPLNSNGTVANRPHATQKNLRSATLEVGFDTPSFDEYWQITGLIVQRLEDRWADHVLTRKLNLRGRGFSRTATPAMSAPALSTLEPFDPLEDGTVAYTMGDPPAAVSNVLAREFGWVVENELRGQGVVVSASPSRDIGYLQLVGRNVYLDFDLLRKKEFIDAFLGAPNTDGARLDLVATLTKASGAQFIKATFTDAEVTGEGGVEFEDAAEEIGDKPRFQAKTYAFDVKTP